MKKIITLLALVFCFNGKAQFTKILDFSGGANGSSPQNELIHVGSFLYGMTYQGGTNNMGIIYRIKPDGTGDTVLFNFSGTADGKYPVGSLFYDGTFLYGMTYQGGSNDIGIIFKIKPDGTGYTKLLDFSGATDGYYPSGTLISDGTFLYGMTYGGGTHTYGTVFKIKPDGTGYATLYDFIDGTRPTGSLIYDGTYLYGMTDFGGANSFGIIFKLKPDGTGYLKIYDFGGGSAGANPWGSLITDGTFLYGMTNQGGASGMGTIFRIKPDGTGDTTLFNFSSTNGISPTGSLFYNGTYLYGMTESGGNNSDGVIFKIKPNGTGYSKLYDFSGVADGSNPYGRGSLIYLSNSLYGVTYSGGTGTLCGGGCGTIFALDICPSLTISNSGVCAGNTATLTASGADTYTWSTGDTGKVIHPTPIGTTVYTVTGVVGTCTSVASVTVTPSPVITVNSPSICLGSTAILIAGGASTYTWSTGATGISTTTSPTVTTTYTVMGTNYANCTNTIVTTVSVTPNPIVTVNSVTITIGGTATLTATGANTYAWSTGNTNSTITPSPTLTTNYHVTGTAGACATTAEAIVTITNSNSGILTYSCTGSNQLFTVPNFVSAINVEAWGAGGGGGGSDSYGGGNGGGGAYSASILSVTPGQVLTVAVGCGGLQGGVSCQSGAGNGLGGFGLGKGGNGGNSGPSGCSGPAGGGGGGTGLEDGATILLVAGGGGGGAGGGQFSAGGNAGGGGIDGNATTSAAAGLIGASGSTIGLNGANNSLDGGGAGAGGGGLVGGGGGTAPPHDDGGGGGAGGTNLGATIMNGGGQNPGNIGSPDLCISCGKGGNGASPGVGNVNSVAGGTGVLIIRYNLDYYVWPGDADENLVVDNTDLLPIGVEYGKTGSARAVQGNAWQADACTDWSDTLSNGKNIKYTDCNGDGTIEINDTLAVNLNYTNTHAQRLALHTPQIIQTLNPDMYLQFNQSFYFPGDIVKADVMIGSNTNPQTNFYGSAFTLSYDNSKVQSGTEQFWFSNSWVGNINQSKIKFSKLNTGAGIVDASLVRITHTDTNGYGKVATLQFALQNSLPTCELYFTISSAIKTNSVGTISNLNTGTDSVMVINATTGISQLAANNNQVAVYPNPNNGSFVIELNPSLTLPQGKGTVIQLYDVNGKVVLMQTIQPTPNPSKEGNRTVIDASHLAEGVYNLSIISNNGVVNKRVVIVR